MKKNIYTDRNQMELKLHGTADFPVCIENENILEYDSRRFDCHWHKEIEFTIVCKGTMKYKVNDEEYTITEGDCLFINANALHMGWSIDNQTCVYRAITVDPSIIGKENSNLRLKYVDTILECTSLTSFLFQNDNDWQSNLMAELKEIDAVYEKKDDCYEIQIISRFMQLWSLFYQNTKSLLHQQNVSNKNLEKIKIILNFIRYNYTYKISLEDIAKSANISKSECSHFFKKYMRETPFEYLLRYRIEKSLPILLDVDSNITETALAAGFSNSSYYTEIFKRFMGITPREYKKEAATK